MKYWAICKFYEPFRLGTEAGWTWKRYEVEAEEVKLIKGIKGFIFLCPKTQLWKVHEIKSGGWLGEGKERNRAIAFAIRSIESTPDLKKQIKELAQKAKGFETATIEDALLRLARGKEEEDAQHKAQRSRARDQARSYRRIKSRREVGASSDIPDVDCQRKFR